VLPTNRPANDANNIDSFHVNNSGKLFSEQAVNVNNSRCIASTYESDMYSVIVNVNNS